MAIIKYRESLDDFIDRINREWFTPIDDYARCVWVDTDKYEIRAKDSYKRELIEQKEKELKLLDDKRKLLEEDVKKLKSG